MAISALQCALQSSWRRAGTNARTVRGRHDDIFNLYIRVDPRRNRDSLFSMLRCAVDNRDLMRDFFALSPALAIISLLKHSV